MRPFKPLQGLLVYKRGNEFYLQTHDIVEEAGKYQWGEGKPFHRDQLQELGEALRAKTMTGITLRGMLPKNVLFFQPSISGTKAIWYQPPGKHYLNFHDKLKLKSGEYILPGLIMAFDDKTMYIFAYKGSGRPTEKTVLYKGPFFNVYDTGSVCMGTTSESTKKPFLDEEINRWERRFFGSRFVHTSDDSVLLRRQNLQKFYKGLIKKRVFPNNVLSPSKYKNLEAFVKKFVKGGSND